MEENKQVIPTEQQPVQPISTDDAAAVAGGGDCGTSSVTVGPVTSSTTGTISDVVVGTYDAAVDLTSHVIERVVDSF